MINQLQRALEHVDANSTALLNGITFERDAETYLRYIFRMTPELHVKHSHVLIERSQGSYTWLATACLFIAQENSTTLEQRDRLKQVLCMDQGMDALYVLVLGSHGSGDRLEVRLKFLELMLFARGSLQLNTLLELVVPEWFPSGIDVLSEIQYLSPLISGLHDDSPAAPYFPSFADFLGDINRSGEFHIRPGEPPRLRPHLTEWCIGIMNEQLRFNIADVPTSFHRNWNIPNIKQRIKANTTPVLLHCCSSWPLYASIELRTGTTIPMLKHFLENRILQWLEVLSLIQRSPEEALAPLAEIAVSISRLTRTMTMWLRSSS